MSFRLELLEEVGRSRREEVGWSEVTPGEEDECFLRLVGGGAGGKEEAEQLEEAGESIEVGL